MEAATLGLISALTVALVTVNLAYVRALFGRLEGVMQARFDTVDARFNGVDRRLDLLDRDVQALTDRVFRGE